MKIISCKLLNECDLMGDLLFLNQKEEKGETCLLLLINKKKQLNIFM